MNENYNTPNSGCCGRNFPTAPENKCNYNSCCMNEYAYKQKACIRNKNPDCEAQAVIPSITVETVDGITNLANCLVHVTSTNTTYYVDDKHRIMITWAGPVDIPGYDMEGNPEKFKDQIVTDTEAGIAVIYDKNGVGFTFGIEQGLDVQEEINNKLDDMADAGTLVNIINVYLGYDLAKYYDTTEDLLNEDAFQFRDGQLVKVMGYSTIGDGGETYYVMSTTQPESGYYITVNSQYYGVPVNNLGNTIVYGTGIDALDYALANSNEVTLFEDLVIPANKYQITKDLVLDMNGHKLTMEANSRTYAWLFNCASNKNITIKNGELDGNYLAHDVVQSEVTGHCGILALNCNLKVQNMNIHKFYYEGIVVNSTAAKVYVDECKIHVNGRNDIAVLSWERFTCSNTEFSGSIPAIEPISNIDCEPYEAASNMGPVEVFNCTFNSTDKTGFGTYLDVNQTKSATIYVHNNTFYNSVYLGHDRGLKSLYNIVDNVFYNVSGNAIRLVGTVGNAHIRAVTNGCTTPMLVDLKYLFSTIKDVDIDLTIKDTGSVTKAIEIKLPEGTLNEDYPIRNFKIKCNSPLITGWLNLHNSTITTTDLTSASNVTLDANHYYNNIYLTGWSIHIDIDALYQKKKWRTPSFTIITNNNDNGIYSSYLPQLTGIGNGGLRSSRNGSNLKCTIYTHNVNTFVIEDIVGAYTARTV